MEFKTIGGYLGNDNSDIDALFEQYKSKAQTFNCVKHGEYTAIVEKCIKCGRDNELNQQIKSTKLKCGVAIRYADFTFDDYKITNDSQRVIINSLQAYKCDTNLIFFGKTGTGKTSLISALIHKLIKENKSCVYVKFYQLQTIKIENKELFNKIISCDFLVIDEIGISDTSNKCNLLFEIIDTRYDNMLYTSLATNLFAEQLKELLKESGYSRIKENVQVFNFGWEDYRIK